MPWISESKTRDADELAISYVLIFLAEWFPNSAVQRFLFWFTLAWVIVTTILVRPNARTLGLRPSNARSVWIVPAIVASWRPICFDGVSAPYPPRVFYWHPDGASARIYRVVVAATIYAAELFSSSAITINAQ